MPPSQSTTRTGRSKKPSTRYSTPPWREWTQTAWRRDPAEESPRTVPDVGANSAEARSHGWIGVHAAIALLSGDCTIRGVVTASFVGLAGALARWRHHVTRCRIRRADGRSSAGRRAHAPRFAPAVPGRATGTCPRDRPALAPRPSTCGTRPHRLALTI